MKHIVVACVHDAGRSRIAAAFFNEGARTLGTNGSAAVRLTSRTSPPLGRVSDILAAAVREKAAALAPSSVVLPYALRFVQKAIDLLKDPFRVPIGGTRLRHVATLVQRVVPRFAYQHFTAEHHSL